MKKLTVGILAHVDAGKTTLSEALLYLSGQTRKLGRVDHQDTVLDTDEQERERGITIFSKQARLTWGPLELTLLDTPGHVDFSAEMERTLQVLDYAVLVVSGADGVQGHTATLWRLLEHQNIPTFLFVNKMDQPDTDREALLGQLRRLDEGCTDFGGDREELLSGLAAGGIGTVVNVGADMESTKTTIALTEKYPFIYGAAGVHPSSTAELDEEKFAELRVLAQSGKIVAIGEIGLDYYWEEPDHETQKKWFHRQLNLARELKLPVIIHSRDAAKDTLDIMKEEHSGEIGGVIHCFSYGKEMAAEYLKMGFYLGIGGVLTFKNAKKLLEVAEMAPLDRLVLETDCPYLAPVPNRGKRNSSLNLPYVAEKLAEIKKCTPEEIVRATEENARRLYRLP